MSTALINVMAVIAGLALLASNFTVTRRRLLPGLIAGVALAGTAALLITIARAYGM